MLDIITREEWGARPPKNPLNPVDVLERDTWMGHYSTGQELGRDDTYEWVREIQRYHQDSQGWDDIGYNFLVDKEGRIFEGRGWDFQGAHCTGWNTRAWGFVFLGNDDPNDNDLTDKAKLAFAGLYAEACRRGDRVLLRKGHRDGKATACPGDEIYAWIHAGMPVPAETQSDDLVLQVPEGWMVELRDGKIVFSQEDNPVTPLPEPPVDPELEPEPTPSPDPIDTGVPPLPPASAFVPGQTHASFTAMGSEFKRWLRASISHDGNGYQPGPRYSEYDDENVRKIQALMGDTPDPVGKEFLGARQWERLFTGNPPTTKPPAPTVNCDNVPPRSRFAVGQSHPCFTIMGKRFLIWLGRDVSKAGSTYTPGPKFSSYDVENVKKVQRMMGDKADGWFGQQQWTRLLTQAPPKKPAASVGIPVDGMRITQHFGRDSSGYAAGEHTGVDFGDSGSDAIRCTASGTVVYRGYSGAWGNRVVVRHANGRYSWYCHLASFSVGMGHRVNRGTIIGMMGNTGNSTGKHLHYQESQGGWGYWNYVRPNLINSHGY